MNPQYDLIVIGAGPGGYVAAIKAAQKGMKVAVVEKRDVGGTCLNRGCIPTKAILHSSHIYREINNCGELGISADNVSYDIEKIYSRKDEVVIKMRAGVEYLFKANKIELLRGEAKITGVSDVKTVTAKDNDGGEKVYQSKNILIATGSVPSRPPIEGLNLDGVITSDELLEQSGTAYKKLIIIGGGVIGVEFATVFNNLGYEVIIIEALDRILPTMDREISQNLSMILKRRGVKIFTGAMVERITKDDDTITCHFTQKGKTLFESAEAALVSIGRKPYHAGLWGDDIHINTKRGIVVDEYFETNVKGIYAIGDVIDGGIQLAHVASAQGINAVAHIAGHEPEIDLSVVPSCVYTDPEIASVGLTEAEAKEKGIDVKTGKFTLAGHAKSVIESKDRSFIKLVFDAQSEVILGAQLMCARATDIISELASAVVSGLTVNRLASVIRPHPTFTEAVTEAVEDAHGCAVHVAPRK